MRFGWAGAPTIPYEQTRLARAILRDHVVCALGMLAFLVLWLVVSAR